MKHLVFAEFVQVIIILFLIHFSNNDDSRLFLYVLTALHTDCFRDIISKFKQQELSMLNCFNKKRVVRTFQLSFSWSKLLHSLILQG